MKILRYVLGAEGGRANAIAIRPAFSERTEEIPDGVIPGAVLEIAGAAGRRQSLSVKSHTGKERFREKQKQQDHSERDCRDSTLKRAQDPHHFALPPGRAPDEGKSANQSRTGTPHDYSARGT